MRLPTLLTDKTATVIYKLHNFSRVFCQETDLIILSLSLIFLYHFGWCSLKNTEKHL